MEKLVWAPIISFCKIFIPSYVFDALLCRNWPFLPRNRLTLRITLLFFPSIFFNLTNVYKHFDFKQQHRRLVILEIASCRSLKAQTFFVVLFWMDGLGTKGVGCFFGFCGWVWFSLYRRLGGLIWGVGRLFSGFVGGLGDLGEDFIFIFQS